MGLPIHYVSPRRTPYILVSVLLSFAIFTCSEPPFEGETGGGTMMTTAGSTGGNMSTGGSMAGLFSGGMDEQIGCDPNDDLGVCALCGPVLQVIKPLDDENCPFIACDELTQYQWTPTDDGGRVCSVFRAEPPAGRCKDLGVCYSDPADACTPSVVPEVLFTVYPGCGDFSGCEGSDGPDVSMQAPGSACHTLGECGEDGRCSAPPSCFGNKPNYVNGFCPDPDSPDSCDLSVDINLEAEANEIRCSIVCATQGGCSTGWDTSGSCNRGGEVGCNADRRQLICRCNGG